MKRSSNWQNLFIQSCLWVGLFTSGSVLFTSGCTMGEMKRALYYDPDAREENAMNGIEDDQWGFVGHQGRGSSPLEDERDPFKNLLMSKEARDIERNLGYK